MFLSFPLEIFSSHISLSALKIRCTSCPALISRLKKATGVDLVDEARRSLPGLTRKRLTNRRPGGQDDQGRSAAIRK
jgi:hypothetical protein